MVNQCNAKKTLDIYAVTTQNVTPSIVAWALVFTNESHSIWKHHVCREIAIWPLIPEIILGLQFEVEIGAYFEEIYA